MRRARGPSCEPSEPSATLAGPPRPPLLIALAAGLALAAGCAASFVTPYDAVLDGRVTELDAKVETFLDTIDLAAGSPEAAYRTNWHFYVECVSEAQTLRRRASADGREEIARTLGEIAVTVEQLRRAHEAAGTLDRALTQQVRATLRDSFDTLHRRQAAVRRGL